VIGSAAFADYSGGAWTTLGDEKLRASTRRSHTRPRRLGRIGARGGRRVRAGPCRLSDAENVILLHRDSRNPPREAEPKKALQ